MAKEIILKSASHEVSDEVREKHLQAALEHAGCEAPPAPQPEENKKQRIEQNLQNYDTQVHEAQRKYEDWHTVVGQNINIGVDTQLAIYEQENGAEIAYYLGQHPHYAETLGTMPPTEAKLEVKHLADRLRNSSAPSFREIASRANYWGKARDLKKLSGR